MSKKKTDWAIEPFVLSATFCSAATFIGGKATVWATHSAIQHNLMMEQVGTFLIGMSATVSALVAGVCVSRLSAVWNASSIQRRAVAAGAGIIAAPLMFASITGDPLISLNYNPRPEPVSFEFERFTCFADTSRGQDCAYVDGKHMVVDSSDTIMDPQPNLYLD